MRIDFRDAILAAQGDYPTIHALLQVEPRWHIQDRIIVLA